MLIQSSRFFCLLVALIAAGCAVSPEPAEPVLPLSAAEQEPVVAEIERMVKTSVGDVVDFVVQEATPERIERLYHTPEFLKQPKPIRENGLIFAGRGNLLSFDKPSDVLAKMSSWFPDEFAEARSRESSRLWEGDVHLFGPFENWELEPAAFLALWNCMPPSAWLRPERNPFERRISYDLSMLPIAAMQSAENEFDFGFCVRHRNGAYFWGETMDEVRASQAGILEMAQRIAPVLTGKFARFLEKSRCEGRGPDDCVLVLRLWTSLTPDDTELAAMLQSLEAEVDPDGPLPELQDPDADPWRSPREIGEDRYDEGLRKLAFLRSKLSSILHAPQAWPSDSLAETLRQMTRLRQAFATRYVQRWSRYQIDRANDPTNPWRVLNSVPEMIPSVRSAILAELEQIDPAEDCAVYRQWFDHAGPALETTYALQRLEAQQDSRCGYLHLTWMRAGETAEARDLRERYVALAKTRGLLRDSMLNSFTDQAERCFTVESQDTPPWMRELCDTWISERQTVEFTLEHSNLTLDSSNQFHAAEHYPPEGLATEEVTAAQDRWLASLLADTDVAAAELDAYAADLRRRQVRVARAKVWRHPGRVNWLMELRLDVSEYEPGVLVAAPGSLTAIDIPDRFTGHYGEYDILRVSDLDEDGNLELWMGDLYEFSACQGDASDLERDVYCNARSADMGEIQGDVLSFFLKSPASPAARASKVASLTTSPVIGVERENQSCNEILLGSVLTGRLPDLDFGNDGNVMGLVCKPHPLNPDQTLVAMFHYLDGSDDEKGFVFAVVDVGDRRVIRTYRDVIQQDASIRIDANSLKMDTADYDLAPGVRTLGVRRNIGYSTRCAEGGESDYLRLFVENGEELELVLKDLPMSLYRITDGIASICSANPAYTIDNVTLSISVLSSTTNGWHDLEVTAHHTVATFEPHEMTPAETREETQVLGILRASGRAYSTDLIRLQVWP